MNETVRKAIFKKVSEEPFAKKFGLRLIEIQEGFAKVEMVLRLIWKTCSAWLTEERCSL